MTDTTTITAEQHEILRHTKWRAVYRMYCGGREDPDLVALCDAGFMRFVGSPGFLAETDGYFTITAAGQTALRARQSETPDLQENER